MYDLSDTICAVCTPRGIGGIAAIRISGPESWEIAKGIFTKDTQHSGQDLSCPYSTQHFEHMHALHGYVHDGYKVVDEVIILPFKSPNSYTMEDIVEIYCHGGSQVTSMVLDLCLRNGARLAKEGEFTFRAFACGRIDLSSAEAVNELIQADTEKMVYASSEILLGSLKEKVNVFKDKLLDLITTMESSLEFPLDVPNVQREEIALSLSGIDLELSELIKSSKEGQILRDGIRLSIIGAPNVGKSSLLNQLLGNERAIVASEPGTTRDVIEEKIIIDGWPVVLIDTAGIREATSTSEVEQLGIERSKLALERCDIALLVFDLTGGLDNSTEQIMGLLDGKPRIVVGNKIDLSGGESQSKCEVCISAKYGTNVDTLKELIIEKIKSLTQHSGQGKSCPYSTQCCYINQRQKELLLQCYKHINLALELVERNVPDDLVSDELRSAISKLEEVSGRKVNEEIITSIFSKFCIGK